MRPFNSDKANRAMTYVWAHGEYDFYFRPWPGTRHPDRYHTRPLLAEDRWAEIAALYEHAASNVAPILLVALTDSQADETASLVYVIPEPFVNEGRGRAVVIAWDFVGQRASIVTEHDQWESFRTQFEKIKSGAEQLLRQNAIIDAIHFSIREVYEVLNPERTPRGGVLLRAGFR